MQLPLHMTFCLGRKWNKLMLLTFYIMVLLPDFPSPAYLQYSQSVKLFSRVQLFATHRLHHTRLPCPSPTPRACSNSCLSSTLNSRNYHLLGRWVRIENVWKQCIEWKKQTFRCIYLRFSESDTELVRKCERFRK